METFVKSSSVINLSLSFNLIVALFLNNSHAEIMSFRIEHNWWHEHVLNIHSYQLIHSLVFRSILFPLFFKVQGNCVYVHFFNCQKGNWGYF